MANANPRTIFDLVDSVKIAEAAAAAGDKAGFFNEVAKHSTYMSSLMGGNVRDVHPNAGIEVYFGPRVPSHVYMMALLQPSIYTHGLEIIQTRFKFHVDPEIPVKDLQDRLNGAVEQLWALYSASAQAVFAKILTPPAPADEVAAINAFNESTEGMMTTAVGVGAIAH